MKRIQTIVCLVVTLFAARAVAQDIEGEKLTLTLPQAVDRALENYPAIAIQQDAVKRAQGLKTTAGIFPNPTLTYYREDLSFNDTDVGEWILSGGLPLHFLWTRWSKVAAAGQQVEAERFFLADVRRQITFEVQKAYVETYFAEKNLQAWQKATAVFDRAAEAGRARFADGDLSGYDQQRIALEQLRYQKVAAEARVTLNNSRRQLAFLVNPEQDDVLVHTTDDFQTPTPELTEQNLLDSALENRPDLQAASATLRSKRAYLTANKWQALPEVSAVAGYKKQVDDFKGSVFQVNVSIPIFDRNQGQIKTARAELDQQILETGLLERKIAMEVKQAFETVRLYRRQVEQFLQMESESPDEFLETALFAYREGEMSLLELLDGVRAYSESFQTRNDLRRQYLLSIFALENATATRLLDF
ncbi:TolC family protein [candidate division KSB1 bacterium]|nr:TolC family protein [candidate division KSB1 bacterium]NIV68515.1 TolC family protein [Phycisphaerae bacterium]NIR68336.1 TolC family protein [candidate division KSB1 bacterium]NIS25302.1 TolC family protein [candidate division KSB1 bacterium]NIT72213.1 TolC family protein [candidate division KSB1 bacterium]